MLSFVLELSDNVLNTGKGKNGSAEYRVDGKFTLNPDECKMFMKMRLNNVCYFFVYGIKSCLNTDIHF